MSSKLWPIVFVLLVVALLAIVFAWGQRRDRERFKAYDDCVKAHQEICQ